MDEAEFTTEAMLTSAHGHRVAARLFSWMAGAGVVLALILHDQCWSTLILVAAGLCAYLAVRASANHARILAVLWEVDEDGDLPELLG